MDKKDAEGWNELCGELVDKNTSLRAEVERLRELVREAYEEGWGDYDTPCNPMSTFEEVWAKSETRAALEHGREDG